MFKKSLCFALVTAAILTVSLTVLGQEITGDLVGTVKDANGAAISGATVTVNDAAKSLVVRTVTTNSDGEYFVPNLSPIEYTVSVEAQSFKKSVQTKVKVDVGQRRPLDFSLEAGNISETVTVTADSVSVELSTPATGTTISGDQARELPINNRNWVQLIALAPGVTHDLADQVYVGTTNPEGQANTVNISVNGARSSQNTFTVDGADVTDRGSNITIQGYPSVDSIGEFKILRSLYPAESGRSGGGQVNVVTRSGTSDFHGSAFWFVRDERFNANNFLTNSAVNPPFGRECDPNPFATTTDCRAQKARRGPFTYNNPGFTIGGPVYFFNFGEHDEGMFRKYDRTFFFYSYERRLDSRSGSPVTLSVPDANLRNGIFPIDVCVNRTNVSTENCTAGNPGRLTAGTALPAAMYSPAARAYLNSIYSLFPLPNNPAGGPYSLITTVPNLAEFKQSIVKIDHSFSDRLSAYYRYQRDFIPTEDGNALFSSGSSIPGISTTSTNSPGRTHTAQMTWVASPRFIVEGRFTYGYGAILSENIGALALSRTRVPITLPFANQRDRIPSITGNGFQGLTSFGPYDNFSYKTNWSGGATWISGSHTFKFGGMYSQYRKNENALAGNNEGLFNTFSATLASGVTSNATNQNLARWANFLVGNVAANGFSQASFDYTADLRQMATEAYAQDEWKVRSNMTIYYGVRYSYFGAPYDKNGRLSNFDPALFTSASAPRVTGAGVRVLNVAGVPNGNWCNGIIVNSQNFFSGLAGTPCTPTASPYGKYVIDVSKTDFAPRIGIAWDPFSKGTTSIRMGYGIYHDQVLNGTFLQNIGVNPPFQITATNATATQLDAPAAAGTQSATVQSLRAVQTDWHTPYMQHWSLDWQQQLDGKTVITAGYFGSKGTHLQGLTELNSLPAGLALRSQCAPGTNYFGQAAAFTSVQCQLPGYAFRNAANTAAQGNTNVVGATAFNDVAILDQLRPYKGFRSIAIVQPRYDSNYHSLQLSAVRRFSGSSQVSAYYTWSKNLTTSPNDRTTSPQNAYDIPGEYQLAAFDRRHVFSANFVYELPFFRNQKGFVGKALGGWEVTGIATYYTGLPFTATTSNYDAAGLGIVNTNPAARPNALCNPNQGGLGTAQQFFNTACFQPNAALTDSAGNRILVSNTVGNVARGNITGPKTTRFDLTAVKNFRFGERFGLQIRAEGYNIFNKVNFRALSTNITAANFGGVTTVRDPRTMQFGAKFIF